MKKAWEDRPREVAFLLNPAFCGMVSLKGIAAYQDVVAQGAPYVFPFLLLPLVLYPRTRTTMPARSNASLLDWLLNEEAADIRFRFAEQAEDLKLFVQEGLLFASRYARLSVTEEGRWRVAGMSRRRAVPLSAEVESIFTAAVRCGRQLARIDDMAIVMSILGVRP